MRKDGALLLVADLKKAVVVSRRPDRRGGASGLVAWTRRVSGSAGARLGDQVRARSSCPWVSGPPRRGCRAPLGSVRYPAGRRAPSRCGSGGSAIVPLRLGPRRPASAGRAIERARLRRRVGEDGCPGLDARGDRVGMPQAEYQAMPGRLTATRRGSGGPALWRGPGDDRGNEGPVIAEGLEERAAPGAHASSEESDCSRSRSSTLPASSLSPASASAKRWRACSASVASVGR